MEFFSRTILGNTVAVWATALATGIVAYAVLRIALRILTKRLAPLAGATSIGWDDVAVYALQRTKGILLFIAAVSLAARMLVLPAGVTSFLGHVTTIALLWQGGIWVSAGSRRWLEIERAERVAEDAATVMTMNVIGIAARIVVWSMVLLLALENLGVDVTALIAGLGIGGVAVALAAQNILGDLFASVSIVLDRPFVLGDFLAVDEHLGSVEEIGLKTTRLRSLSGEQLVFSNNDLLASRIRNYGRMFQRRVVFETGVTYDTPRSILGEIPGIIRSAVAEHGEQVRFDRSHFAKHGDFALVFETVYYVLQADFNAYMDIQQAINLRLHERFEDVGIEFAFPTQTIVLASQPAPE